MDNKNSKLQSLFKDKKNIAIIILAFLLLISFGGSQNNTTNDSLISQYKSQIEELTSNNEKLNNKIEENENKIKELENNIKSLQEEKAELEKKNISPTNTSTLSPSSTSEKNLETYILNKNTKVFHYPYCSSTSNMKESNKEDYSGTRVQIINRGYKPCQKCNP